MNTNLSDRVAEKSRSLRRWATATLLALSLSGSLTTSLAAQPNSLKPHREARYVMGTILEITLYHRDDREARRLLDESFSLAQRLDDLLSNYQPQSEIHRFNRNAGRGKMKVSRELYDFLSEAKSWSEKSHGVFDITVGPLMGLWQKAHQKGRLPSPAALREAQGLVGYRHLILHPALEVELERKGMWIDTGGVGKGYAVDQIAALLQDRGIKQTLINFGRSSIYAIGAPPEARAWKLLLKFPGEEPLGLLELKDQALSASDSLGRPMEIAGKRYGHLIDLKNGLPMTERIQAIVLAPSATEAEALSKHVALRGWRKQEKELWGDVQLLRRGESGNVEHTEDFPLRSQTGFGHSASWPPPPPPAPAP